MTHEELKVLAIQGPTLKGLWWYLLIQTFPGPTSFDKFYRWAATVDIYHSFWNTANFN